MYVQGVENVFDLDFNGAGVSYGDVFLEQRAGVQRLQLRTGGHDAAGRDISRMPRRSAAALLDGEAAAAGLRPVREGEPPVQPA